YRGYDDKIHQTKGENYYEFFSLWDTYRAQNQLLALLSPERAKDIASSILKIKDQQGWLPRWGYANFETNIMTGDPVTPFLVDLWRYGALKGKEQAAYRALRENAFGVPDYKIRAEGRAGNPHYLQHGFVPYQRDFRAKGMDVDPHHGASATLEYAQADGALSIMAEALGKTKDAQLLAKRSTNWQRIWDAEASDTELGFKGFPRPRMIDASWFSEIDGSYNPRSENGFHEGTAWQYQWLVQQNIPALVQAMGGREQAGKRLDAFFAMDALQKDAHQAVRKDWVVGPYSYYKQFRYNPNNEPDIHTPWMYTHIGQAWKTTAVLRAADSLFSNAPNGVTGNDDLGTMSAWYVFSALGIYPASPGSGNFLLHTPQFRLATIHLANDKALLISTSPAQNNGVEYIQAATWQKQKQSKVYLSWEQLHQGGELHFELTSEPAQAQWGSATADVMTTPMPKLKQ
ncbi:MAG: glycoside hydrolase family 92 protein, partial [Undibacterium sp.]|nr:glycoside hydrolase family 92 protein [Undibacterium sp.]